MKVTPVSYVSESLAAYPPLLNRYLVSKLITGVNTAEKLETAEPPQKQVRVNHAEAVNWTRRLRGNVLPTDKQAADDLAIGGMKDTAASVARLSYSQ